MVHRVRVARATRVSETRDEDLLDGARYRTRESNPAEPECGTGAVTSWLVLRVVEGGGLEPHGDRLMGPAHTSCVALGGW